MRQEEIILHEKKLGNMKIRTGGILQSLSLDQNSLDIILGYEIISIINIGFPHPNNRIMGHVSQLGLGAHLPSLW